MELVLMNVIALCALMGGLGLIFNNLLDPVKKDMARVDIELKELKTDISILKTGQDKLESKLDQLLAQKS